MSKISLEEVKKIARLGGLTLSDERLAQYQQQFEELLDHFESLNEVDVSKIEPLYHAVDENHFRDDMTPAESLDRKDLLANAPDHDEVNFRLGRILGGVE